MKTHILVLTMCLGLLASGCTTTNPDTGEREYDPVKTEKVRAAIKPVLSTAVAAVIQKHPEARRPFSLMGVQLCSLRTTGTIDPKAIRDAVNAALLKSDAEIDPIIAGVGNLVISLFEINYADRLQADLSPEQFTWNLLDVLCDSIHQGVMLATLPEEN